MVPSRSLTPCSSSWSLISPNSPWPSWCCSSRACPVEGRGGESGVWCSHRVSAPTSADPRSAAPTPPRTAEPAPVKTGVFHRRVAQVVTELDDMDSQHHRQGVGPAASLRLGIVGPDTLLQPLPGNQGVHPLQEEFSAGPAPLVLVVQFGKGRLLRHRPPPLPWARLPSQVGHNRESFRDSLTGQSFPLPLADRTPGNTRGLSSSPDFPGPAHWRSGVGP